ncbi:MAG: excinuclease ABC subunit UvrA [Bdellovibrionaceae bacterium]|nr:excinuclease ABC subunit UvrA [Bdellovibrionales bacterium]MCB9083355.1 excinuclease ABC subunit UvrA [Pseudobdellovibrionaceae bacterium]
MPPEEGIWVRRASEHNLKGINVFIPRNKITVITGLSGSGKSSLAFDTIYAEGQRRYVESLSAYSRNFLEQMKKPDVEAIVGLSPAIAIDQKSINPNPRSTVGTVTEVYDYLRLLYARVGVPRCPEHRVPVDSQSPQQIVDEIMRQKAGTKFFLLAPVAQGKKGEFLAEFRKWASKGFTRARVDGEWIELAKAKKLAKRKSHDIDLLIDRLIVDEKYLPRLKESVNLALSMADGMVAIEPVGGQKRMFSIHRACPVCGYSFPEIEPRLFSFNNPRGACETCHGLGVLADEDEVEDRDDDEASEEAFEAQTCPDCDGKRLNQEALNVQLAGKDIAELSNLPVIELKEYLHSNLKLADRESLIAEKILRQILGRLDYLERVGTGYLSLDRKTRTLSGGEAQRIRLASQVGSALVGVLYVLDEPSIGLHPRDHRRLLEILEEMRERGNTVLLVEHDEETIRAADHLIDLGPRAGLHGGELMAEGTPEEVSREAKSLTGRYLSGKEKIPVPSSRRKGSGEKLILEGATGNNLRGDKLELPLGCLIGITGVSGSGKSTLVVDTLYRVLARHFYGSLAEPSPYKNIKGIEHLDKVIEINQKPIGRTPRSIPATYVGLFPVVRQLFAELPEAKIRGYRPGHFSFNVKGGRCEVCGGGGQVKVEMHFLSNVYVTCDACLGNRYTRETLNMKFREKSIADVLQMSVEEAAEFFQHHPPVARKLETLKRVGLDYMTLGQSSTTLSGGEAQRVKLSKELSKRGTGKTLYILDEPTTGLHFDDVKKLIELLQELVDQGNTVLVIEHQMDVIRNCDYLVDLGPEGGVGGGEIVAAGTPEEVARSPRSVTGQFL